MSRILFWCAALLVAGSQAGSAGIREVDGLRIVELSGTAYDMGYEHGRLLRDDVRAMAADVLGYFRRALPMPLFRSWRLNSLLDRGWRQARPFMAPEYLEELRGLAEGSGVPLAVLERVHAIPDHTYACANFAAWGQATSTGRLIHARNLDWSIRAGIQRHAVVFVMRPAGRRAFVSAGWAGFIGVLTGVNEAQISVGQVGAETVDLTRRGLPMPFVIRRVLEESGDLEQAAEIIRSAPRTVGINYVIADHRARRAVAMETTWHLASVFEAADEDERSVTYARPLPDVVVRSDTAMDPAIRDRQLASKGRPGQPGLEPPGGSAYEVRYLGQVDALTEHYGQLDVRMAQEIARRIAPDSNIQSAIIAWPELWLANAEGDRPAARTAYHHLDLEALLSDAPVSHPAR